MPEKVKSFQQVCCENWIFTDRRMKWDHFLSQRNRKYTRELLIRLENMKLLQKSTQGNVKDIGIAKDVFEHDSQS